MRNLRRLMDTSSLEAKERRLEEGLRGTESTHKMSTRSHITPTVSTTHRSLPIVIT